MNEWTGLRFQLQYGAAALLLASPDTRQRAVEAARATKGPAVQAVAHAIIMRLSLTNKAELDPEEVKEFWLPALDELLQRNESTNLLREANILAVWHATFERPELPQDEVRNILRRAYEKHSLPLPPQLEADPTKDIDRGGAPDRERSTGR